MNVIAHGIDLVDTQRIARMIQEHGERFLTRTFTAGELAYTVEKSKRDEHLAARFAAKEAVMKALGTGWSEGVKWTDIEVLRKVGGEPALKLHGQAASFAKTKGITHWLISLTHTEHQAMASVIACGVVSP